MKNDIEILRDISARICDVAIELDNGNQQGAANALYDLSDDFDDLIREIRIQKLALNCPECGSDVKEDPQSFIMVHVGCSVCGWSDGFRSDKQWYE